MVRTLTTTWVRRILPVFLLLALAGSLALIGCKGGVPRTPIQTLLDDPGSYDGKVVNVGGEVSQAVGVLGYGGYQLNDGTASILVVTKTHGAPREGAKVGVQGTFRSAFTMGTTTAAVIEEETRTAEK